MTNSAPTTYTDSRLFVHDNRDTDFIDFMPPVSRIGWVFLDGSFNRHPISDENYQAIYDEMVDEQNVVAYGEGHDGAANHALDMTGFDRMILEDCNPGSGHIQRQSINIPQVPKYFRAEHLEKLITDADLSDCQVLVECFRTLEATPEMITQFIKWLNKGDIDKGIEYFTALAYDLAALEAPTAAAHDMDPEIDALYNPANMVDYEHWTERNTYADGTPEQCHMPEAKVFAYQTINTEDPEDTWLDQQPPKYQKIIRKMNRLNYMELKQLAIRFTKHNNKGKFTAPQAQVFWSRYRYVKKMKRSVILTKQPAVKTLLTRLRNAPKSIGFKGFWLYDQQNNNGQKSGQWSAAKTIDAAGWSMAWEQYRALKDQSSDKKGAKQMAKLLDE